MRFRKKPVVIEAWQWPTQEIPTVETEDHPLTDAPDWIQDALKTPVVEPGSIYFYSMSRCWAVKTLEGHHVIDPGDWIIRGVKGELYPCKPDIFQMTYDTDVPDEPLRALSLGEQAYEAYRTHSGGVSLVSGAAIPPWHKMDPRIQEAWSAAAAAVAVQRIVQRPDLTGEV